MTEAETLSVLWRDQPQEHKPMTVGEIRERAAKFRRQVRNRNATEYAATSAVVLWFRWSTIKWETPLGGLGNGLIVLAAIFVAIQLARRGAAGPPVTGDKGVIERRRADLVRQRDALLSMPHWYLAPFVPGLLLVLIAGLSPIKVVGPAQPWALRSAH